MGVEFDSKLLRRYGGNAPRYTSYPTALQFHDEITALDYRQAAASSSGTMRRGPLSLYVHIPFCANPCYYCACNRVITRQTGVAMKYVSHLLREIEQRSGHFDPSRPVEQLHFGGGTPTYLATDVLAEILESIRRHYRLTDSPERDYSIEVDPRTVTGDTLPALRKAGFNRLSLGIQDFDAQVQRTINRIQSATLISDVLDAAKEQGFRSTNFDLIYGLPRQTSEGFARTLEKVVAMRPDRIALYGYAHMPQMFKAQRRFTADSLPGPAARIALLDLAVGTLSEAGYEHIGMDHFALPEDSLTAALHNQTLHRNFQGYTTHAACDLVNFGSSAIGRVGKLYVQNAKSVAQYESLILAGALPLAKGLMLSRDDEIRSDVIQQIMCRRRISIDAVEERWRLSFADYFDREIESLGALEADELVVVSKREIRLTPRGVFLMRNVAMAFDAYASAALQQARASQAI